MAQPLSQKLDLKIKGLYTSPNQFSAVPPGSLSVADNLVINAPDVLESRKGQKQYGTPLTIGSSQVEKLFNYASSLIVSYNNKMAYDSGSGVWVDYSGTYSPPSSDFKIRSLEALRNFYFTTSAGIYKIDALTNTPRKAGVVEALSGTAALSGVSGFLQNDTAVAYRLVWGYIDANNNLLLGAPSQRLVVANSSGGSRDVALTYLIPSSITTSYFYQIYRSNATLTAADEPNDELQLVIQGNPTAGEITAKSFSITDITPFSLMRATLYTSPSLEGIRNANYEPPFAKDMDVFKGSAFYANIRQKQALTIALISAGYPSLGYYVDASTGTVSGSPTLSTIASTANLRKGMRAVGTGIPSGSVIIDIPSGTTVTINKNATATASVSVEFQDRFSIGDVDYWGGTTNDVSTNTFLVYVAGTPAQNINQTALDLIQIINTSASNTTLYGYYISSVNDLPGQIVFKERSSGGASFSATSTAGTSFSPPLTAGTIFTVNTAANPTVITSTAHGLSSGNQIYIYDSNSTPSINGLQTVTVINANSFSVPVNVTVAGTFGFYIPYASIVESDNDAQQNRVAISKQGQVEAVPSYTYFNIGSANFGIDRVVALRDGIFFFKQDGIYRLSGESFESYTVLLVDNTVTLKCPESAVPFNNQVFCFTTQGVSSVSDTGVELKSIPIEDELLVVSSDQYVNFSTASFGIAYESARQYIFFTVSEVDDTYATQAFVYNSLTNTWTRWPISRTCGVVGTTVNKLFLGQPTTGQVLIERKNYTNDDFADEEYAVTIASVGSTVQVTLVSAASVAVNMTLVQGFRRALITAINGNVLTIMATSGFVAGAATVFTPINNVTLFNPIDAENPGILKQFSELSLVFKNAAFTQIDATFSTNISGATRTVPIINNTNQGWGSFNWGEAPWGGVLGGQNVLRTYFPREQQLGSWAGLRLSTNESFTGFSLQGISILFNATSSWIK
jgi:hypothetical protein